MTVQHETTSELVGKEPCPSCGSKDNLARYSDGHAFCFGQGCGHYEPGDGSAPKKAAKAANFDPLKGEFRALTKRKITEETCRLFRYRVTKFKGELAHVVDIVDRETGQLTAQKIRTKDKDFPILGDVGKKPLIGSHLWTGGKRLVITEGEIDMMTVSQIQGNKWPVVSILNGAASAKKNLLANLDYLKLFEEVVLMFDMDEPGQSAAKECAEVLLSIVPVKIARLSMKDPNELHVAGRGDEITRAIWNAEEYRPDGLLEAEDLIEAALEDPEPGLPWIFDGMNKSSNGRHYGEIHTIGAGTGVGKTDFILQQADYDIRVLDLKVGLFLVENDPAEVLQYLAGKADGRFYYEPGHPDRSDKEAMRAAMSRYSGKASIYDNFGLCDWQLIKARVLFLISRGFRVFYIDHLTALATGGDKDEKAELEDLMADVAEFAKRHNVLFILISHLATAEGKAHEEGGRVAIKQFKGSRAIGFWSHAMYGLERDQQAEDEAERQTTTIRQLKRRKFGKGVGRVTRTRYNPKTGLSYEVADDCPFDAEPDENPEF
jgi:twinkle protein